MVAAKGAPASAADYRCVSRPPRGGRVRWDPSPRHA